ncbi:MAG: ion transporter [Hydrococcus sp. Prado102]|jgi:voltage-gated potassium channel|nr:ion transporter [Hydrococcus sp. Prado102]
MNLTLWRKTISYYLEDIETPIGKTINLVFLGLIFLSLAIFVIETYSIPQLLKIWLDNIDLAILILFTIEYLIRFWCADSKIKFVFSLFSIFDLLSIVPLLIGIMDIRFIRIFRWFRLLRLIRFLDFKISIFKIETEDGVIFARIFLTLFSIIFVYSGFIYQAEHSINPTVFSNFFDALYFSIVTMTTVGFGDVTPISEGGRALTVLMILTGILLIPWQVGELVKKLLETTTQVQKKCSGCGLSIHDFDANHCKICGTKLEDFQE